MEWESQNVEIMKALKAGTSELNRLHEEMPVDKVIDLLAEANEAIEVLIIIQQLFTH